MADAIPHAPAAPDDDAPANESAPTSPSTQTAPAPFEPPPHPAPPSPSPAVEAPPRPERRRGLGGLLRRPVEHLRAYLSASVDHQLRLQAERTVDVAGAVARLEVDVANARAESQAQAHDHALRLERLSAGVLEGLAQGVSDLANRLTLMEARSATEARAAAEREAARASVARQAAGLAADQLALAHRSVLSGDHAVARLDQLLGVLGPRLDELEIKVRPVMEIDAESVAVRTADGYVMLPRSEPLFVTAVANATSGGLEPGVRRVLRALLRPGDACADVGANVGLLTVAMAFAVGGEGRVWAFEPEERVRAQLARTLHLNGLAQVELSGAAVGAAPGRLTFHQSPIIGHSSLYALPADERAGERATEVEVTTLDSVVPAGVALTAVKIDVEGAELDVLAGMARVIADSPNLAVVAEFGPSHLHRVGIAPGAWFAAFAAHGLEPRLIAEPFGTAMPTSPEALAGVESANLVFVRPGGAADGRLPR